MPAKVRQQITTLLDGTFLDRKENVVAFGNPGTGKTHLLCAIGQELIRSGRRVYFYPMQSAGQESADRKTKPESQQNHKTSLKI